MIFRCHWSCYHTILISSINQWFSSIYLRVRSIFFLQSIASDGPSCEMENRGKHSFKKNHSMQYKYEPISTQFMMSVDFCVSGCVIDWFTTTSNNLSLFYGGKTVRSSLTIVQKKHFEQADSFFSYPSLFGRSSVACGSTGQMISLAQLSGVTLTN